MYTGDVANEEKLEFPYSSYSEAAGELHSDLCNLFNEVEYQAFVFPIEGIHHLISSDHFYFQSDVSYCDHVDSYFHSEEGVDSGSDFCMHYEDNDDGFVLPNELIEKVDMLGKAKKDESFSLPQENVNENKVYDRGKEF